MFTIRGTRRRPTLAPLVPRAMSDRIGARAEAFAAALRQPGETAAEPPRAQPGSPQVNDEALAIRMAAILVLQTMTVRNAEITGFLGEHSGWRRWTEYCHGGLKEEMADLAFRGDEEILDRMAVRYALLLCRDRDMLMGATA